MKVSQNNGKSRQFLAAIIVNLICVTLGISIGWASPIAPQLRSSNPPIGDKPMSEEEVSWITGLLPIGGLSTISFCNIVSEYIGRKRFALLAGLPLIVSWKLIIFTRNYLCLYLARLLIGVVGAMTFFVVPLYVSEIASEDVRGILGSLLLFALNIGILLAYVAGAFLSYQLFASLSLFMALVYIVAFSLMPETPICLIRRNLEREAHKSLMFFRGNNKNLVEQELKKLRSLAKLPDSSSNKIKLSDLFKDRATRNGLIISFGLVIGQQLSGIFVLMSYAETIFQHAGTSISAETASIIIAAIQIIGSYGSTMLIERAGRRLLTLISCLGMTVSHIIVGLFFYLQNNKHDVSLIGWLPLFGLSSYIITYCLGMGPVPFVFISEAFSLNVSSFASNMCFVCYFIIAFTAVRVFDLAMKFLGTAGCFFVLATFCAASLVFYYYLLPETKGRKREDIVDELAGMGGEKTTDVVDKSVEIKMALMNTDPV